MADTDAGPRLLDMLPLTIEMRDHMRQEKTGYLPRAFLQGNGSRLQSGYARPLEQQSLRHLLSRRTVPQPGIRIFGQVEADVSIFDRAGDVTVEISRY